MLAPFRFAAIRSAFAQTLDRLLEQQRVRLFEEGSKRALARW